MTDAEAVNSLLAEHVAAVNSGDIASNLAGFTDDLIYMPPDGCTVRGKPAFESFINGFFDAFTAEIEMVAEETVVTGDWAFQWGSVKGTVRPKETGDSTTMDSTYLYVYQRQADGTWRIARDIYNSNVPPDGSSSTESFYESDCQGQTSSSLIAGSFFPWQSALIS